MLPVQAYGPLVCYPPHDDPLLSYGPLVCHPPHGDPLLSYGPLVCHPHHDDPLLSYGPLVCHPHHDDPLMYPLQTLPMHPWLSLPARAVAWVGALAQRRRASA
ncbi:hypothetical protein DUNSADRAFT_15783 [Dunaliella salina]|uniref:Uncharacterized protein n=1 Tax=Dunaliella salina TaxID=3046 RepID=A0ABQ7H1E9_DUNSA|nr:hypothetical protein DUNSADRAFT_15783 [Dunaliella salina]|eukprot:KAF5840688.1 hypothetical protein DUNSADRAFT_15783 [Dunaliella salina]